MQLAIATTCTRQGALGTSVLNLTAAFVLDRKPAEANYHYCRWSLRLVKKAPQSILKTTIALN